MFEGHTKNTNVEIAQKSHDLACVYVSQAAIQLCRSFTPSLLDNRKKVQS